MKQGWQNVDNYWWELGLHYTVFPTIEYVWKLYYKNDELKFLCHIIYHSHSFILKLQPNQGSIEFSLEAIN